MKINAGRLERRLEILAPLHSRGEFGEVVLSYVLTATRRAARLAFVPTGLEEQEQRLSLSRRDYLLRLDSVTRQMTTEWRVREQGATAQIIGLDADPADGSLIVRCEQAEA